MTSGEDANGVARAHVPRVTVHFDRPERDYVPDEPLVARYEVEGVMPAAVNAVERSVVWYTEGKGEEDLGVHHFDRVEGAARVSEVIPAGGITVQLPASPLSYEGIIVKIRWCVRVRLFFVAGRDYVSEHVFELGAIPPARGVVERLE